MVEGVGEGGVEGGGAEGEAVEIGAEDVGVIRAGVEVDADGACAGVAEGADFGADAGGEAEDAEAADVGEARGEGGAVVAVIGVDAAGLGELRLLVGDVGLVGGVLPAGERAVGGPGEVLRRTLPAEQAHRWVVAGGAIGYKLRVEHLEGWLQVVAALKARRRKFQVVLVSQSSHSEGIAQAVDLAAELGVPVRRAPPAELDGMAHGRTHGGVIAVCTARAPSPWEEMEELLSRRGPLLLLLLEGIEDARNLGFTLRSADALGVDAVLLKKHVWDFDAVEVSRAASGAWDSLPMFRVDRGAEEIDAVRKAGVSVWGCVPNAKRAVWDADLAGRACVAIGGEKRGLSAVVRERCDGFLTIPMRAEATSLSLSHAATAVLAEAARQRALRVSARPGRDSEGS